MTHKKKKSLSDNISFLLSSANGKLVNPDEDINTESKARVVDEDELDEDINDEVAAPSKLRQKNVALLDSIDRKYRGGVTSRKDLKDSDSDFDEDRSEDDLSEDNDDEDADGLDDEGLSDGEDGGDDDDDDDVGDSEDEAIANLKKKGSESFVSYTDFSGDENDEGDESENDTEGDGDEGDSAEGTDENESEDGGIKHFSTKDASLEVKKGQAVRNQLSAWDTLMECRIQMQKLATYSNQLPQANVMPMFRSQGGKTFSSVLAKTENNVTKLLEAFLNLQEKLLKQYPETRDLTKTKAKLKDASGDGMDEEIPSSDDEKDDEREEEGEDFGESDVGDEEQNDELNGNDESDIEGSEEEGKEKETGERPHKRRKLSEYSDLLAKNHKEFTPYLNNTIQKWNTKTQVAVGRASSKNFSAFEQSTVKQIEHILADKSRLIRRTQLRRSDFKVLGQVKEECESSEAPKEDQVPDVPDVPVQEDQKNVDLNKEYDPEIFDDTDFYHQLLRELIEKKTADVTDPVQLGRQWIELQKMRSKMKRKVDVKASKGRRLRYSVHPKLVNFMAPQPDMLWSEEAKNELYGSLFGQRKG